MSLVTCPLSPATATDPPLANSTTINSRLVCKDPKTPRKFKAHKNRADSLKSWVGNI